MGPSAFMTESTELYNYIVCPFQQSWGGGCPNVQLKELRPKKGSGMPMRGVESIWKSGPWGWASVSGLQMALSTEGNRYPKRLMVAAESSV